jgi:hypothetical protein
VVPRFSRSLWEIAHLSIGVVPFVGGILLATDCSLNLSGGCETGPGAMMAALAFSASRRYRGDEPDEALANTVRASGDDSTLPREFARGNSRNGYRLRLYRDRLYV